MTAAVLVLALVLLGLPPAQQHPADTAEVTLTATAANVSEPGSPMKIRIFRWSTDEERGAVVAALNPPARGAGAAAGDRGGAARGGRAGARGRGRGAPAAPLTPAAAMAAALGRSPTLGYIWTNDITGYSIKYAYRAPLPDGGERLILASDRRLGAHTAAWTPTAGEGNTDYEFTVFEIRLGPGGLGEGKTSLAARVVAENETGTVALENYAGAVAMLQNVKR